MAPTSKHWEEKYHENQEKRFFFLSHFNALTEDIKIMNWSRGFCSVHSKMYGWLSKQNVIIMECQIIPAREMLSDSELVPMTQKAYRHGSNDTKREVLHSRVIFQE